MNFVPRRRLLLKPTVESHERIFLKIAEIRVILNGVMRDSHTHVARREIAVK